MKAWAAQFTLVTGIHRGYPIYGQHFTHLMCIRKYPSIHLARLPTSSYPTYLYVKVRVEFAYLKTRNLTLQPGLLDKSQRATSIESIRPWVKAVILVAERCLMHCGTGFQERAAPTQSLSLSLSLSIIQLRYRSKKPAPWAYGQAIHHCWQCKPKNHHCCFTRLFFRYKTSPEVYQCCLLILIVFTTKKKHGFHHQDAGWIDRFHGVDVEISAVHV